MKAVIAALSLIAGLKVLSSPLLSSVLSSKIENIDVRILPTVALVIVAIPVLIAKINADARVRGNREARRKVVEKERDDMTS